MTTNVRYRPTTPNPWETLRPSGSLPAAWIEPEDWNDVRFWMETRYVIRESALYAYEAAHEINPKPAAR